MSVRKLSPTANLLRNSRLFALPHPLPRPTADFTGISNFDSDTATTPYPTHQAIETSEQSLSRGDWGLKRPLPLKSTTRTSTPTIRIQNIDSIDFITDFASSADHANNLKKWQEMDMPISVMSRDRRASAAQSPPKSVFESELDSTAINEDEAQARWKFQGPWLAGLEEGDFNDYVAKKVQKRKSDFRRFLRQRLSRELRDTWVRERMEKGEDPRILPESGVSSDQVSEADVDKYIKRLRKNEHLMEQLVSEFLDLPREKRFQTLSMGRPSYSDKGPPQTHPSAGLSYLRTASHTFNHPLHGPQDDKPPIQARVLKPQGDLGKPKLKALLGVAGVVTEDSKLPFGTQRNEVPQLQQFDPDFEGGGKVWVEPKRANILVDGKIQLDTTRAETPAVRVFKMDKGEVEQTQTDSSFSSYASGVRQADSRSSAFGSSGGNSSGYGLEDLASVTRRPQTKEIEEESELYGLLGQVLKGKPSTGKQIRH